VGEWLNGDPVPNDPVKLELGYHTHLAPDPDPREPFTTESEIDLPLQYRPLVGLPPDTEMLVGAVGAVQATHAVPLQLPESHLFVAPGAHDPLLHVSCFFSWPPVHEGPLPHAVPLFLLLALQTAVPLEQSMAPV
jgi:hypothetical protein